MTTLMVLLKVTKAVAPAKAGVCWFSLEQSNNEYRRTKYEQIIKNIVTKIRNS